MKYLLGRKESMTQLYTEDGRAVPATIIHAGPVVVTQIKNKTTDGYEAIQVGFEAQKETRVTKAELGHTKAFGTFKELKEFRVRLTDTMPEVTVGASLDVSQFAVGDTIRVTGTSKGKGFQGVVKRHGFHGGPRSHGQKHSEREPGSIGGGLRNRVPKGMRMAGRTGSDTITIKNLKVVAVDSDQNILVVKGAVPGRRGTLLSITA